MTMSSTVEKHSFTDYENRPGILSNHNVSAEQLLEQQSTPASYFSSDDNISTIPTTCIAVFQALLLVTFIVLIYILCDVLKTKWLGGVQPPFALLTSIHVVLWIFIVLIDRYLHYHHRMLRTFGYLDFYTKTKDLRRVPLWVLSLGNAVLLVVVSIFGRSSSNVNLLHLFKIGVTVELGIALIATIVYIAKVAAFNKARLLPDAFRQKVVDGFSADMYSTPEIGFRFY